MNSIQIRTPDDMHRHLRRGPMLHDLMRCTDPFLRAVVMPNATGDICDAKDVLTYRQEIRKATPLGRKFDPLMTIKLTAETTPEMVIKAAMAGAKALKYYPPNMTTNSGNGVPAQDLPNKKDIFAALEEAGMLLLLHGEHDQALDCLNREEMFLGTLSVICKWFPELRIVLEHITTRSSVKFVEEYGRPNLAATITPHHLIITLDDVIGDKLSPHNFCKPIAKLTSDRAALITAATSGNQKFFAGTDCAAHLKQNKECAQGCAGVFTGQWGLPWYAYVFDQAGKLTKIEDFVSKFGAEFYGLPLNPGLVELVREPVTIPEEIYGIVPFGAGRVLPWSYK